MLTPKDNELMCKVGPGTPMGELMRQYWIPALMSTELPSPDCPPTRLRLLGENLIGFRATSGAVGLIANSCPHRGASLFFGRNEEEGLRCVYHGWKFDVGGNCVDMPSEPAESNFKSKVKATTYPCAERAGVIWTYMGSRETPPPLPHIEPNMLPDDQVIVEKILRECNWFQGLEGDIDTVHANFLHRGLQRPENLTAGSFDYYMARDRAPDGYSVYETEFGTTYGAHRPAEADTNYWRIANFLFPFYTMIPTGYLGQQVRVRAWVPIDDENMMFWTMSARARNANANNPNAGRGAAGVPYLESTSQWVGKFRISANRDNDYLIDRDVQREGSFSGIPGGAFPQDQAVTESMGPIYQRDHEHLGTSDSMIIRTRRRVIGAAVALRDRGEVPPGVDNPEIYATRSGGVILPRSADWLTATRELRKAFVQHSEEDLLRARGALPQIAP
jgi:phenylpropionate dioxygenase-like ring-hydroxylating dioxygenase large terminal subunit